MTKLRIISDSGKPFSSRTEAGLLLAHELEEFRTPKPVVLGIPRGGIITATQIARTLGADLDIVLSHKLGAPANPELAIGAVCENGALYINETIASYVGMDEGYVEKEKKLQMEEITRRVQRYRAVLPKLELDGRVVIITDDGVATGATMQAALWAIRQENPKKVVLALPVGPKDTVTSLSADSDETICLRTPPYFEALGRFYLDFYQVEDAELLEVLERERQRRYGK